MLQKVDQWLFVYSPEKSKHILNLSPLEKLIYDAESGREIKSIQDYGVEINEQEIEPQDKEKKEQLSYTIPTEDFSNFSQTCSKNIFLENSVKHVMANDFEDENKCNWYIHIAFEKFPLNSAQNVAHLALQTQDLMQKRRALSIIAKYKDLLQKVIDSSPDEVKNVAHDEKFVKVLLESGVEFNQEQLKLILEENNLASIYYILSKKPFSLQGKSIISDWFYGNVSHPEFFDFNSVTKCEGIVDYTNQAIILSPTIENQYGYAKRVCMPLLEALHTGDIKMAERFVLQDKPNQKIFILKESNEIFKKIAQEDKKIFNLIDQICQEKNCDIDYSENFTEAVSNFVEKYAEILQNNQNFLDCLSTKIKAFNVEENQRMYIKVSSQPAISWPSIGIGPSAYFLHQSSCKDNFNMWTTLLAAGALAWSGWKTYAYYNNYQRLTRAMHLQEKTNKLEGYLISLKSRKKLNKENLDEQNKENTVSARQWPTIGSKIWGPLALGFVALPALPTICKITFKTNTQIGAVDDKSTPGFLSNLTSGLSFSALSAWLWRQNKNKFEFDDAQKLFISSLNHGEADGFAKMQKFKKHELLSITSQNET